jgi:hypothetical protein
LANLLARRFLVFCLISIENDDAVDDVSFIFGFISALLSFKSLIFGLGNCRME